MRWIDAASDWTRVRWPFFCGGVTAAANWGWTAGFRCSAHSKGPPLHPSHVRTVLRKLGRKAESRKGSPARTVTHSCLRADGGRCAGSDHPAPARPHSSADLGVPPSRGSPGRRRVVPPAGRRPAPGSRCGEVKGSLGAEVLASEFDRVAGPVRGRYLHLGRGGHAGCGHTPTIDPVAVHHLVVVGEDASCSVRGRVWT